MTALIKAIFPGFLLAWLVATFVGTRGSTGGLLQITHMSVNDMQFYTSPPLFLIATGIGWGLFKMME